jgi:APA family basic amino acid/polyamine antiporter
VPANGLWIQCLWASLLCLTGKYGDLLTMVIFGVLIFYVITILGIFILRRKQPDMPRPYKAFGYPVLPLLYIIVAASLALLLLKFEFNFAISCLVFILFVIPVYYVAMARSK